MKKILIFTLIMALHSALFAATKNSKEDKNDKQTMSMSDVKEGIETAKDVKETAKDAMNTLKEMKSLFK
ncbi:MAG: hypothetical protein J1D99_00565 [Campylobacter sp.]|nr:hypothetical protein [Campylobacter sp.]